MQMEREFPGPRPVPDPGSRPSGARVLHLADARTKLPEGVTPAEWALERTRAQNPRILTFLVCIRLLEEAHDSNYAILHCSPQRLHELWRRVLEISDVMRLDLAPALAHPSCIPALEEARRKAELALQMFSRTTLADLERLPSLLESEKLIELRKLICVSIGKLHGFVQDTFCEVIAADPRSLHDSDYFMSKRFPRDIEEAEWLHASVARLGAFLKRLQDDELQTLERLKNRLRDAGEISDGSDWQSAAETLRDVERELTTLLKETLALRGIRFDELEALDRYAYEIPSRCRMIFEFDRAAHAVTDEVMARARAASGIAAIISELTLSHAVLARRISELLSELLASLQDLAAFVPLWMKNLRMRRALFLHGIDEEKLIERGAPLGPLPPIQG